MAKNNLIEAEIHMEITNFKLYVQHKNEDCDILCR